MSGQIKREHRVTVMREVAALQDPDAVIVLRAVQENETRFRRVEWFSTRVREQRGVGSEFHAWLARGLLIQDVFCAALSARARSSIRSSTSSSPIDSRIMPCVIPAASSS